MSEGTRIMVLSPLIRHERGNHDEVFKRVRREGFVRVRINGEIHEVNRVPELSKKKKHSIEAVVDRIVIKKDDDGATRHTRLNGKLTLRLSVGAPYTERRHVERVWELIQAATAGT